jgi:hypothetical protein
MVRAVERMLFGLGMRSLAGVKGRLGLLDRLVHWKSELGIGTRILCLDENDNLGVKVKTGVGKGDSYELCVLIL